VHVGHDRALRHSDLLDATDLLVFTDGGNVLGQLVAHSATARIGRRLEGFDIAGAGFKRDRGGVAHEALELVVLGDEVGFRVDLDGNALGALDEHADQTFGRGAARLLLGGGKALGAQRVNRGLDVAARFGQRLLGVHHASAGALAQLLHVGDGNIGHGEIPFRVCSGARPCSLLTEGNAGRARGGL